MSTSHRHEGLVALLQERPAVVSVLLEALGIGTPQGTRVQQDSAALTDLDPAERRADLVLTWHDAADRAVYALVVKVQLAWDANANLRWPAYVCTLRARQRCPVDLLVVCFDRTLARRLARPIILGHGTSSFTPLVLGPSRVPKVADPAEAARNPELAVISALAHHDARDGLEIVEAAIAAAAGLNEARRGLYFDLIWGALNQAMREALEAKMAAGGYEYQSEFARTYFAQGKADGAAKGKAEGKAEDVLRILVRRGLSVSEAQRVRVMACVDLSQLELWLDRAIVATNLEEVFEL